ncbi:hypothetical protein LCGC14_1665080 [marine sediment metagenome]|uniref:Uncharacterized protein n=1 Tax=marine sediment metagenome TaxID=412755 RepID=A0A0F9HTM7_9ZZZZ
MSSRYAGVEWIEKMGWGPMSPLGAEVADILGYCWSGIYHIDNRYLREVKWSDPDQMWIRLREELATHDFSRLTELVLLAHLTGIRIAVLPKSNCTVELTFYRRDSNEVWPGSAHPTLERVVKRVSSQWRPGGERVSAW